MILFEPEIRSEGERVTLAARVEMARPPRGLPDELTFSFPARLRPWIGERSDPFLTALLLVAMQHREDVEVRGRVSARLLLGLEEYQRTFSCWFPWRFQPVALHVAADDDSATARGAGIGCAFSGGVDSFYSLWSHLPANDPNPRSRLSHAVFVHGFDVLLEDRAAYDVAARAYGEMAERIGIDLVLASTNVRSFVPAGNWGVFHGAPLVAVAQALERGLHRFYVPSSHTYNDLVPWGSDPRIDHLLSTEALEVVHDGASATRIAKTAAIAGWSETHGRLRVCLSHRDGRLLNCCRCEKCVRTMLALDMLGELAHHRSFPLPLERRAVRACRYRVASDFCFPRETIAYARTRGRWDVVCDLGWALAYSRAGLLARRVRSLLVRLRLRARRALAAARPSGAGRA